MNIVKLAEQFEKLAMAGAGLTRIQKDDLAFTVMRQIANLTEFPEMLPESCQNVDPDIIKNILRIWARKIPGSSWDTRLD